MPKSVVFSSFAAVLLATSSLFAATSVLTPEADAYVKSNAATTNFGAATSLIANNSNGVRIGFLRFSLAGVTKPITSASLQMTVSIAAKGEGFSVYGLANDKTWTESTLAWGNAPGIVTTYSSATGTEAQVLKTTELANGGAALATFTSGDLGAADTLFTATSGPLLDFLNASTSGTVTFLIAESGSVDTSGVAWNSREATAGQPRLTVVSDPLPAAPALVRVVLIGGQSNADGRAAGSGLPTSPINYQATQGNVPFYYYTFGAAANTDGTRGLLTTLRPGATQMPSGGFGPEISLGYDLSRIVEQSPRTVLALIKYAKGGSSLHTDWKAGGDATTTGDGAHYVTFQQVATAGLARLRAAYPQSTVKLAAMIWVQGESDIDGGATRVAAYKDNLAAFIADLRATLDPGLPFVLSRISSNQTVYSTPGDPNYADYLTLRAKQAEVAATVPGTYLIDTDDAGFAMNSDNLHFNAAGQLALGKAFAARLGDLLPLRILSQQVGPGGLELHWNALPLRIYEVLSSSDLLTWSAQTVGAADSWTDASFPTGQPGARFYRVRERD